MDLIRMLADPVYVAKFQRLCGVVLEKPPTCDQQTQTRNQSTSDSDGNSDQDEKTSKECSKLKGSNGFNGRIGNGDIRSSVNVTDSDSIDLPSEHNSTNGNDRESGPRPRFTIRDSDNGESNITSNNNVNKISNHNSNSCIGELEHNGKTPMNKIKTVNGRKGTHIIEPTSRVHSKGSIFDYKAHSNGVTSTTEDFSPDSEHQDLPPITAAHIKYKSLLYLAYFGAFLGNEGFYLTFFPFCIWNLDFLIVRQVAMLWCVVMYLGQATKDYLRWPRPPSPPVVRLESHYIQEYSMPSTHAMAGTAIPLFMAYIVVDRYQIPVLVAATVALLWFSITCLSRLYLGVHTILDLLAGFLYAILIFFTFMRYVEGYDLYQQTHPFAGPVLLSTALAMCTVLYPSNHKNSSKGDAVQIVAACTGCFLGGWLGFQLGVFHLPQVTKPYVIDVPTLSWCVAALARFVTGLVIIAGFYIVVRLASIRFFSYMYGLEKVDKTHPGVSTAYKFTTYVLVGACISLLVPLVHQQIGISRPALFYEIL